MSRRRALLAIGSLLGAGLAAGPAHAASETCDGKVATIVVTHRGTPYTSRVTGTPGDDVIVGTARNDRIDGAGGNDTVGGLSGADPQIAGLWFYETVELDQASFSGATSGVTVHLGRGTAVGEGVDTIETATPAVPVGVIGSPYDDHLTGTAARDQIDAGGGDDTLAGGGAGDLLSPDTVGRTTAGWATIRPPDDSGPKVLEGDDVVRGGPGKDFVYSKRGIDRVLGGGDGDGLFSSSLTPGSVLAGGPGRDRLMGRIGGTLRGGAGRDELTTDLAPSRPHAVDAGPGRDHVLLTLRRREFPISRHVVVDVPRRSVRVDGRRALSLRRMEELSFDAPSGRFTFLGGPASETVSPSGDLRVRALGRGGADHLRGGHAGDHLDGGPGRDTLAGERGRDRCLGGETLRSCEVRR